MKVKVKICGIRTIEVAKAASDAGADFLGFNFVPFSKRYISVYQAKEIIALIQRKVKIVGVFQNEGIEKIKKIVKLLNLDYVQLHGSEEDDYQIFRKYTGVIKAFSLSYDFDIEQTKRLIQKFDADYFLLDRKIQGEGKPLDLRSVRKITFSYPVILAGGLEADNVREAVAIAQPKVVDVAMGVETYGRQDIRKIKEFIMRAKYD